MNDNLIKSSKWLGSRAENSNAILLNASSFLEIQREWLKALLYKKKPPDCRVRRFNFDHLTGH